MRQFPLIGAWSLALHARDDGAYVGAILRGNVLHADLLCLVAKGGAFAVIRVARAARVTEAAQDIRRLFRPGRTPLDAAVQAALEAALSRELGAPTQLVLLGEEAARYVIMVPLIGKTR